MEIKEYICFHSWWVAKEDTTPGTWFKLCEIVIMKRQKPRNHILVKMYNQLLICVTIRKMINCVWWVMEFDWSRRWQWGCILSRFYDNTNLKKEARAIFKRCWCFFSTTDFCWGLFAQDNWCVTHFWWKNSVSFNYFVLSDCMNVLGTGWLPQHRIEE